MNSLKSSPSHKKLIVKIVYQFKNVYPICSKPRGFYRT